jgi:hypothetical protein
LLLWAEQPEKSAFRPALILTSILETNKMFRHGAILDGLRLKTFLADGVYRTGSPSVACAATGSLRQEKKRQQC